MTTTTTPPQSHRRRPHRGARPDQEVRHLHRRRQPVLHRRARPDHRLPRPERRGQDHHAAHAARPGQPVERGGHHRRSQLPRHHPAACRSWARPSRPPTSTPAAPVATTCGCWPTRRASGAQRVDEMLELVGIPAAARKRAGGYSMGMRQRLGLAAAMLGDPQVLILDEPANGLDPEGIRWLRGFLRHLSAQGKTVLISSHMLQEVEQTVDDVVIINNGRLIKQGAMDDLHGEAHTIVRTTDLDALRRRPAGGRRDQPGQGRQPAGRDPRPASGRRRRAARRAADLRAAPGHDRPRGAVLRADRGHQPQPRRRRAPGQGAATERDAITGQEGGNE